MMRLKILSAATARDNTAVAVAGDDLVREDRSIGVFALPFGEKGVEKAVGTLPLAERTVGKRPAERNGFTPELRYLGLGGETDRRVRRTRVPRET